VCSTGLNSHLYKRGFPVRHTIAVKNSFCYHSPVTNHLKAEAAVPSGEITRLLQRWQAGDATAFNELLPMIRSALRRIARHHLGRERRDHTMQPSSLVQEAFVRLIGQSNIEWQNRVHFFAVASHAMRHILVDYARKRLTLKRGKAIVPMTLEVTFEPSVHRVEEVVAIDLALRRLAEIDERKSKVVEMRFFAGLSVEETAEALGVAPNTVSRDWNFARAWLRRELTTQAADECSPLGPD